MSANADLITVGTYTCTRNDTPNIQFCIIWVRMLKMHIFGYLVCACVWGGGASMIRLGLFCFPAIL